MYLYILSSQRTNRYYVGTTTDMDVRLRQHNDPAQNPSRWTRSGGPWDLAFSQEFATNREALRAEKYLKRMKSRAFLEKLIRGEYKLDRLDQRALQRS